MSADECHDLIARVIASRHFSKAPQLRDILIYLCERTISEPGAAIREQEIGCNVLGRKASFNPSEDNIVRVQMSHLRRRLEEYFAGDGKDEPVHITIPKGAYIARFVHKPEAAEGAAPVRVLQLVPILTTLSIALAVLCIFLAARPRMSASASAGAQDPFWTRVFGGSQPASIVVGDSCMALMQDLVSADIPVSDYVSGRFPGDRLRNVQAPELRRTLQLLSERQYTSIADLNLSSRLVDVSREFGPARAVIRYSRHLNIRDFKNGNFVLIGSRRAVPWVQLFEQRLNFHMEEDRASHGFCFRNRAPARGEPELYVPGSNNGTLESYADIAMLPNLCGGGAVLILSGLSMVDTEAAGEVLTRNDVWTWLSRMIGKGPARDRYFEILLKTRAVAGASESSEVAAYRVISATIPEP